MRRPRNAERHSFHRVASTAESGATKNSSNDSRQGGQPLQAVYVPHAPLTSPASTSTRYDALDMARALSDMLACALDELTREWDAVNAARVAPLVRAAIRLRSQVWWLPTLSPDDGRAA